ncbi:MAG TPA: sigma factor, partial [Pirellulaceae bacterium]|nr:sigma factor [Pirellulaceae bacterium]
MKVDSERDSSSPSGQANFATTHWSMVLEAGRGSLPDSATALAALCAAYWYPLYAYVRRRGRSANDARDLTQDFFAHLLEKESLQAADPDRGRFRSFLLTAFKNFLSKERERSAAQKRGGDVKHLSIDYDSGEQRYQFEPVDDWTPEKIYERRWALTLLEEVMTSLQQEYEDSGKAELFDQCKGHLTGSGPGYEEAARSLAMTEGALRVA